MGKLTELKEWLTIPEAAAQLSEYFNEKVSAEDLFRFVLSNHLKLAVSFLKEMPAHRKDMQPNIDLDEVVWLKCGEWDMPMLESNISYVRQLIADLPMFEIPSATMPLVVEDNTGEQYCLLGENIPFEAPPGYSMPKGNIFVVRTKELNAFINSTQATGSPTSPATVNIDDLPKELQLAISVYYEFWHEKPEEMNTAKKESIEAFLSGNDVSDGGVKRIDQIARPEKYRKGGVRSSEKRNYKGKSQEK